MTELWPAAAANHPALRGHTVLRAESVEVQPFVTQRVAFVHGDHAAAEGHAIRGDEGHLVRRERIESKSVVVKAIVVEDSPCGGGMPAR